MKDVITMNVLASKKIGKGFGNKVFQYAFLKTYAKRYHLRAEAPEWIGRYLFGHADPYIARPLPVVKQISPSLKRDPIPNAKKPYKNVDFLGYFQYHTKYFARSKRYIRSLFQPIPPIQAQMDEAIKRLRAGGKTIIGLHLRRGDYERYKSTHSFCFIPPNHIYINWLHSIWNKLDDPILFLASDEPHKVIDAFSAFHPITSRELGIVLPKASFYPDFYILTQCDKVAISNSTFSFAACMMNERAKAFLRPHPKSRRLISFDPWNSEVLYRRDLDTLKYSF